MKEAVSVINVQVQVKSENELEVASEALSDYFKNNCDHIVGPIMVAAVIGVKYFFFKRYFLETMVACVDDEETKRIKRYLNKGIYPDIKERSTLGDVREKLNQSYSRTREEV